MQETAAIISRDGMTIKGIIFHNSFNTSSYPSFGCRVLGSIGPEETEAERLRRAGAAICGTNVTCSRKEVKSRKTEKTMRIQWMHNNHHHHQETRTPLFLISGIRAEQDDSDMFGCEGQELGDFCSGADERATKLRESTETQGNKFDRSRFLMEMRSATQY
eukprot:scaffold19820_cov46-Cylindrotheca_fusiformis.AAC.1